MEGSRIRRRCAAMVVSVSEGSPRFLMSDSRPAIIFLKVRKSSSPFLTDCACRQVFAWFCSKGAKNQAIGEMCSACALMSCGSGCRIPTSTSLTCSLIMKELEVSLVNLDKMARTGRNCMYFLSGLMKRLMPSLRPAQHLGFERSNPGNSMS